MRTDESELTDEDREDAENAESLLRALALAEDDTDIVEEQNDLTSDFFVAYYDPATETIAVQGDESDDLDVTRGERWCTSSRMHSRISTSTSSACRPTPGPTPSSRCGACSKATP